MHFPEWLSLAAIVISLVSLAISFRNAFIDRPRLSVTAHFVEESEYGEASIVVVLINKGRRPVILRLFGGYDSAGQYGGTHLDHESGGKRLGEHERHEIVVRKNDTVLLGPEDDMLFEVLWVEDSLGTQYLVPGSREFIKKLRQ